MTITHPDLIKRIAYNRQNRDYDAFVTVDDRPEQYIGSADNHLDAEKLCDDYAFDYYADTCTPEKAAELIMQEIDADARHVLLAEDMGAAWEIDEAERLEADAENEPRETLNRRTRGAFAALSNEALGVPTDPEAVTLPSGWMRMPEGDILDTNGMRVPLPAPTVAPRPVCPIPCAELHQLATTDRRGFAAALAALSESELTHEAAVYAAFLAILGDRQATAEATLAHFRNAIALHCSGAVQTAPSGDAICCTLYELALTNIPALAELLRAHTDIQRQQLAWRYAAWLRRKRGIDRTPAFILRGWDTLLVGMAASGIGGIALERAAEQTAG